MTLAIQRFGHSNLTAQEIADRLAIRELIDAYAHCDGWPLVLPATKVDGQLDRQAPAWPRLARCPVLAIGAPFHRQA
jgi:hypothetical protein